MPKWVNPWKATSMLPDMHRENDYVGAGLPDCQPDSVCSELVRHLSLSRCGVETKRDWRIATAVINSMCWLHNAGKIGIEAFQSGAPMSFSYDALVQSLGLISKALVYICCIGSKGGLLQVKFCMCSGQALQQRQAISGLTQLLMLHYSNRYIQTALTSNCICMLSNHSSMHYSSCHSQSRVTGFVSSNKMLHLLIAACSKRYKKGDENTAVCLSLYVCACVCVCVCLCVCVCACATRCS